MGKHEVLAMMAMAWDSRRRSASGDRTGRVVRTLIILWLVGGMAVAGNPARGQAGTSDSDKGTRRQAMEGIAKRIVMKTVDGGSSRPIELLGEPIYRFDDPARSFADGTVWAWGRPGRPAALLTLSVEKKEGVLRWLGELTSLSASPLSASGPENLAWTPQAVGDLARTLPDTPKPAMDEPTRSRQLREIARRFGAYEFFEPVDRARRERYELRLLPQPVHRYSDPKSGLLDGAIFVFAYGTNPEITLLIEARQQGQDESGPSWTYGLARIAGAELHVDLDHHEIWRGPKIPFPRSHDPYAIMIIPME